MIALRFRTPRRSARLAPANTDDGGLATPLEKGIALEHLETKGIRKKGQSVPDWK
jgi:hypothetical protein